MAILPVNMTNPRRLGQIAQIFAEGQMRNQELQLNILKQQKEAQDIQNVAKLYQDETAKAKDPQGIMNAFGKTAFGLMKFGQKASPILNWLEKDATLRMKALEPKETKQVNLETVDLDVNKFPLQYTPQGSVLKYVADRNPYTGAIIPNSERLVPYGTAPGASSTISTTKKKESDLESAKNLVASLESDADFMASYNTFAKSGKMERIMAGDLSGLDEIPLATREKTRQYLTAKKVIAENTPTSSKELTPELAKKFLKDAGGNKNKARELAKAQGYKF